MITEAQRLQMLSILAHSIGKEDEIIQKVKDQYGLELTKPQLKECINNLKQVRGI